jgi:hypothetical protein
MPCEEEKSGGMGGKSAGSGRKELLPIAPTPIIRARLTRGRRNKQEKARPAAKLRFFTARMIE